MGKSCLFFLKKRRRSKHWSLLYSGKGNALPHGSRIFGIHIRNFFVNIKQLDELDHQFYLKKEKQKIIYIIYVQPSCLQEQYLMMNFYIYWYIRKGKKWLSARVYRHKGVFSISDGSICDGIPTVSLANNFFC